MNIFSKNKSRNNENITCNEKHSLEFIWVAFKAHMRWIIISFSVKKKQELFKVIDRVEK